MMKSLWIILIAGIVLRIVLSSATFHPDMLAFKLGGDIIAEGKILNLYDFSNKDIAVLNYPPPIFWFHGVFNILLGPILGTGLLVKIPYLIFDLLIAFLFLKIFTLRSEKILAFSLWMFNPIALYSTYMMGQFDIIPTFFILLSIYFVAGSKLELAALALGGGIAFKIFPVFLIIPLIILGKSFTSKVKIFSLTIIPYIFTIVPYLPSDSFRSTALLAAQSSKSLYASIPVSGGEGILLFPASLVLFYLFIWSKRADKLFYWKIYLIPLLLFFIFTHYHPQWLIWITPFLILDLVVNKFKNVLAILLIFGTWFTSLFFFDSSLTIGLFAPVWPTLKDTLDIWTLLNFKVDYNLLRSLIQTIFAGASAFLIYKYLPAKKENA